MLCKNHLLGGHMANDVNIVGSKRKGNITLHSNGRILPRNNVIIEGITLHSNGRILPRNDVNIVGIPNNNNSSNISQNRSAVISDDKLWPHGLVYWEISNDFSYSEKLEIKNAMAEIESVSSIRFFKRYPEGTRIKLSFNHDYREYHDSYGNKINPRHRDAYHNDYVYFNKSNSFSSKIGKQRGKQNINLMGFPQMGKALIMHEIMHALGFEHEQSRHDRDQYVIIHWENIPKEHKDNYEKLSDFYSRFGSYDYDSIMHYDSTGYGYVK
jgi:hypothetical protein